MTDMPLDEALQFKATQVLDASPSPPFAASERPIGSGIDWLSSNSNGFGYLARVASSNTIDIINTNDNTTMHTIVAATCIVRIAFSSSLLAVALSDGSLECYNVLLESTELRWRLEDVHSFISTSIETSLSSNRDAGASAAGPLASLTFAETCNLLVLVDASNRTATIWNAAYSNPTTPVATIADDVTCAAWISSTTTLAVGKATGEILLYSVDNESNATLESTLVSPAEEGFCCTHLNSFSNSDDASTTLLAGFCSVIASDEEDDDDDDDEDAAEHIAAMYVATLQAAALATEWTDLGDVVPFFSVPKHGRHVYYSQALSQDILAVACNVGSDICLLRCDEPPMLLDLPEGANATTPITEDDDYTFCVGLAASAGSKLHVAATDGTVTHFQLTHTGNPTYFDSIATTTAKPTSLNLVPLVEATAAPASPASPTPSAFGNASPTPAFGESPAAATAPSTFGAAATTSAFGGSPAAAPTPSTFGAAVTTSAFGGSPTAAAPTPSTFGAAATTPSFGGGGFGGFGATPPSKANPFTFGTPAAETKTGFSFGSTSALGARSPSPEKGITPPPPEPASSFGSGISVPSFAGSTFGASFQRSGFGSLAASEETTAAFGSPPVASNPFGAFVAKKSPTSSIGLMAKPLFGSSSPAIPGVGLSPVPISATKDEQSTPSSRAQEATMQEQHNAPGAKAAGRAFDSLDDRKAGQLPKESFEELLEELGEGFHGDEFNAQLEEVVNLSSTSASQIDRAAFIKWYCNLQAGDDNSELDEDELAEREEERQRVREVFKDFSEDGGDTISIDVFPEFFDQMGSTYDADGEHGRAAKHMAAAGGGIKWSVFIDWYIRWLFDGDEDYEDEEEEVRETDSPSKSGVTVEGWGSTFTKPTDSWKCEVCMVQNESGKKKCAACETIRPGFEDEVAKDETIKSNATGGSMGGGGFSFGVPAASSSATGSSFGFGAAAAASSTGMGGSFGFGAPSAATAANSGFSFGTPAAGVTPASTAAFGFGKKEEGKIPETFGFGAPSKKEGATKSEPKKEALKPAAVSGYPPMSTTAPKNPFGKGTAAPDKPSTPALAKTSTPSTSGGLDFTAVLTNFYTKYDPDRVKHVSKLLEKYKGREVEMGAKLVSKYKVDNPFESLGNGRPSVAAAPASSASGYPPMPTKAPSNPFGKSAAPVAPKAAAPVTGYPPMAAAAPSKPFGESSAPTPSAAVTEYPPMAAAAPSNPFGKSSTLGPRVASAPSPFGMGSTPVSASKPPSEFPPVSARAPINSRSNPSARPPMDVGTMPPQSRQVRNEILSRPVSNFEAQFVEEMAKFQESICSLSQSTPLPLDAFEREVTQLVSNREKMWNYEEDFKAEMASHKERSLFLVSRKPDLERQLAETKRLVAMNTRSSAGQGDLLSSQQLDASSERTRRKLAAEAIMIPRNIDILEARLNLIECASRDEGKRMDLESSGKEALLETVKNVSDLSSVLNRASARCASNVAEMSSKVPRSWSGLKSPPPSGRKPRSSIIAHPAVEQGVKSATKSKAVVVSQSSSAHRWNRIEQQFRRKATNPPKQTKINLSSRVLVYRSDKPADKPIMSKTVQSSFLLSPQQVEKIDRRRTGGASVTANLFSPPSSLSARAEWDAGFTTDQAKAGRLSFNLPRHLKEVNTSDAARDSLAQYGTSPEKLAKVTEAKRRGEASTKKTVNTVSQNQPSTPKRASAYSSAAFPPMATKAPTPFLQKSSNDAASMPIPAVQPKSSAYPPMSKIPPKSFGSASEPVGVTVKSQGEADKGRSSKIQPSAFGGMKSLGDSLFGDKASAHLAPSGAAFGSATSVKPGPTGPDFHAELTKFYGTHNPSRVKDVAKTLEKYKGREYDMFSKVAAKYKVANPLDSLGSTVASKPATVASFGTTAPASSTPFGASAATPVSSTPFGALAVTPASSTPFGASAAAPGPVTSFGASASAPTSVMPFGVSASSPASATPFGSQVGANTAATSSTVPFGAQAAPSPFGSAAQPTSAFGGGTPAPTPFGSSPSPFGASQVPPQAAFGSTMSTDAPSFGQQPNTPAQTSFGGAAPASFGAAPPAQATFAGKSPRELLFAFYQQYNAAKLNTVDQVLQKYKGQEEKLFRNLAKKYSLDPSVFGLMQPPPQTASGFGGGGFGQSSPMGGTAGFGVAAHAAAPAFGSPSGLGGTAAFGGGGFGAATPAPAFGNTPAPAFGGGGSTGGGFGSLAQQGGGGGFGAPAAGGFAGASPFGAPAGGGYSGGGGSTFGGSPFGGPRR